MLGTGVRDWRTSQPHSTSFASLGRESRRITLALPNKEYKEPVSQVKTIVLVSAVFCATLTRAQIPPPSDIVPIAPQDVPRSGSAFFSMENPTWPPAPCNMLEGTSAADCPLYFSPSLGPTYIWLFDYGVDYAQVEAEALAWRIVAGLEDGPNPPDDPGPLDLGTNGLYLSVSFNDLDFANKTAVVWAHNTTNHVLYSLLKATNVAGPWVSAGLFVGTNTIPGATAVRADIGDGTDRLFFRARTGQLTEGDLVANRTGDLLVAVDGTNDVRPIIDGVTNVLHPFHANASTYSNWVWLPPRLHCVNFGYDASDNGVTNNILNTNAPQGVLKVVGFSQTITNLALSYNPLTNLDVSGWSALQDLECWHCTNMLAVSLTNCPQLSRVCFEAIQGDSSHGLTNVLDFSGCTNIADIRAADNRLAGIVFANGAGPRVWHLCVHDNTRTHLTINKDFSEFPSLNQFWVWDSYFSGPLKLTAANCTNLTSVQANNNRFTSADFSGQRNLGDVLLQGNVFLTNLNIANCSAALTRVDAVGDSLTSAAVDGILVALDAAGAREGTTALYGGNNGLPSAVGLAASVSLSNKNWQVYFNHNLPQISDITVIPGSNSATIAWTTDIAADSTVYYGLTTNYGRVATDNSSNTAHSVSLSNLMTNTLYHFKVVSSAGANASLSDDKEFITLGGGPDTNGIVFVSTSSSVTMRVLTSGCATVVWKWGDGSETVGEEVTHTFTNTPPHSNLVTITPATALKEFGRSCSGSATLQSVSGLTNYPNLEDIFLFDTGISQVSLAGCSNLVHIALANSIVTPEVLDNWFIDLANAQPSAPATNFNSSAYCDSKLMFFFYPASPQPSTNSALARTHLSGIGWQLYPYTP
jgi:hypothetical protein